MSGKPLSKEWPHWLSRTPFYFLHIHWTTDPLGYGRTIVSTLKKIKRIASSPIGLQQTTERGVVAAVLTGILTSPRNGTIPRGMRSAGFGVNRRCGPSWGPAVPPQADSPWGGDSEGKHNQAARSQARGSDSGECVHAQLGYSEQTGLILQFLLTFPNSWGPSEGLGTPLGAPGHPPCCQTNPLGGGGTWAETVIGGWGWGSGLSCSTWDLKLQPVGSSSLTRD